LFVGATASNAKTGIDAAMNFCLPLIGQINARC
jgi:hypothetical protein